LGQVAQKTDDVFARVVLDSQKDGVNGVGQVGRQGPLALDMTANTAQVIGQRNAFGVLRV
jgi:hypothetical protein